ncbi:MAG: adenylyltransferase/cytidyltransferase family protein [Elusimicrobiota bacterium]
MSEIFRSVEKLADKLEGLRKGKKLVFTNGCFDILHPGHIHVLKEASGQGDILVVGLNDDGSVRRLKGAGRPLMEEDARAEVLAALGMVDYVIFFSEDDPYRIIKALRPDVLVKGGEYGPGEVVGEDVADTTVRVEMKPGVSTTELIRKIIDSHEEK